jgi:TRAP-type mannitol/chloroaromatic compound transport system substrate-binding protein
MVNQAAFDTLPKDLQVIVDVCCRAVNDAMLAEYTARNQQALDTLVREHGVQLRQLPADVLVALRRASEKVLEEVAAADPLARRALDSLRAFRSQSKAWHAVSEESYYANRD